MAKVERERVVVESEDERGDKEQKKGLSQSERQKRINHVIDRVFEVAANPETEAPL